jgi:CBS domain-containing protein
MEMRGITLFIFGGVAQMGSEPPTPRAEFLVAIVGPISSVLIGAAFFAAGVASVAAGAPQAVTGTLRYLGVINVVLAAFNLVPAFPLDGGRVLRAVLWGTKRSLRKATRIASQVGSAFGVALMVLGVLALLRGVIVGGLWWFLIGTFVRNAARMSYQQVLMREALAGEPVSRFMRTDVRTVPSRIPLTSLVDEYFFRDYHKMYPVVDDGRLVGAVTIDQVKAVPREEWSRRTVGDLAAPLTSENTVLPETDAVDALGLMSRGKRSRLLVADNGRLLGLVTISDLLKFLSLKVELEET